MGGGNLSIYPVRVCVWIFPADDAAEGEAVERYLLVIDAELPWNL